MKIYNIDKTKELLENDIDYNVGKLVADKLFVAHHNAIAEILPKTVEQVIKELQEHDVEVEKNDFDGKWYKTIMTYKSGGKDVAEVKSIKGIPAKEAWDEYEDILVYVPFTQSEIDKQRDEQNHAKLKNELEKVMEDIQQEQLGIVRDDYVQKRARAAEIINELRVLEGKKPREISL